MNSANLTPILPNLFSELVHGSPDPNVGTYMLNRGDAGLLQSLEKISADAASSTEHGGGSIAMHTDHIRYGLSLLNRWAAGADKPWKGADWTASWRIMKVSDEEWRVLRDDLRREADAWREALSTPRELHDAEAKWVVGSVAHLAYHLGAIRQIDRVTRGPTAEEERAVEATLSRA